MKRRGEVKKNMTQDEFNVFLDAKLQDINPEWAAANRAETVYYGKYLEIKNSKATSTCPLCNRTLPIYEFSHRNKHISGLCWECRYQAAIDKIKFNPKKYNLGPLRNMVSAETKYLKDNGYVKLGVCFCGQPATKWHHPNYNRPHEVTGYCGFHHNQLHEIIIDLEVEFEFIPYHNKYRYYGMIKQGNEMNYVIKADYVKEITKDKKPLTYKEIKHLKNEQYYIQLAEKRAEERIICIVKRLYGENFRKKDVAEYLAREAERAQKKAEGNLP